MLERSVVSIEAGPVYVLELHEMNRDSCFIKVRITRSEFAVDSSQSINQCKVVK